MMMVAAEIAAGLVGLLSVGAGIAVFIAWQAVDDAIDDVEYGLLDSDIAESSSLG